MIHRILSASFLASIEQVTTNLEEKKTLTISKDFTFVYQMLQYHPQFPALSMCYKYSQ